MQGIIFDMKRFALHDGPGIRTTVFLKGCNMRCNWCHNPESIKELPVLTARTTEFDGNRYSRQETIGQRLTVEEVMEQLERDRVFMEESGGGVTFSGGEPTVQPAFLWALLSACKKSGLNTAVDTNGLAPLNIYKLLRERTDLFLFDLKHGNIASHVTGTGKGNSAILSNLNYLLSKNARVRVRIPVIPGFNNNSADMQLIGDLLLDMPGSVEQIDLLPYHAMANNKYKTLQMDNKMDQVASLNKKEMLPYKELLEKKGFTVKIGG